MLVWASAVRCILRVRGGSSPWSYQLPGRFKVFSAYAEVVPSKTTWSRCVPSILRVRGGSSLKALGIIIGVVYSPRTRR